MRVLVFGESITEGFWDTEGGWVARLRRHYSEIKVNNWNNSAPWITNLGVSGNTIKDILERFDSETKMRVKEESRCAYIISTGGNDSSIADDREAFSTEDFKQDLKRLLDKARKYTSQIMIVGLTACDESKTNPVQWASNIRVTNERRILFDKVLEDVCNEQNLPHVSLFETMQNLTKTGKELYADGLHPNNEGHQLIFELVRPELDKMLNT